MDARYLAAKESIRRGELLEARLMLAALVRDDPSDGIAMMELGAVLGRLRDDAAALRVDQRAVQLRPNDYGAWVNLGLALLRAKDLDSAHACFERALGLNSSDGQVFYNAALVEYYRRDFAKAVELFDIADSLRPGCPSTMNDRAFAVLQSGDWRRGWELYEARWNLVRKSAAWYAGAEEWQGQPLAGKSILIHHEQGMGDTIMMARFMRQIVSTGAHVTLAAPAALLPLLKTLRLPPAVSFGQRRDLVDLGGSLPQCHYHAPMMSLPRWLEIDDDTMISGERYFDVAEPVSFPAETFNIGLVWKSGPTNTGAERIAQLADFFPLLTVDGARLYSLQKGPAEADIVASGMDAFVRDLAPRMHDYADTARLVAGLDLVVTVDTSVAHMAGAIGKPVITLTTDLPCWRWRWPDRDAIEAPTAWYPTMTLLRQERPGDWSGQIARATDIARNMASECIARRAA